MLDQLNLLEPLLEHGVFTSDGINYRNGQAVPGGMPFGQVSEGIDLSEFAGKRSIYPSQRMDKHGDTRFTFSLHLRQRLIEQAFEKACSDAGVHSLYQHQLVSYAQSPSSVTSIVRDIVSGHETTIESAFIVGCDGGHSFVRKNADIKFIGDRSLNKWIRMDALVETDMPSPRTLNSIQSDHHGLILWCPIDEGRTRIGYVFSKDLQERYGEQGITEEVVMQEAIEAVKPFKLEFKKVDWCE